MQALKLHLATVATRTESTAQAHTVRRFALETPQLHAEDMVQTRSCTPVRSIRFVCSLVILKWLKTN